MRNDTQPIPTPRAIVVRIDVSGGNGAAFVSYEGGTNYTPWPPPPRARPERPAKAAGRHRRGRHRG